MSTLLGCTDHGHHPLLTVLLLPCREGRPLEGSVACCSLVSAAHARLLARGLGSTHLGLSTRTLSGPWLVGVRPSLAGWCGQRPGEARPDARPQLTDHVCRAGLTDGHAPLEKRRSVETLSIRERSRDLQMARLGIVGT